MNKKISKIICIVFGHKKPEGSESRFVCSRCASEVALIQ